MRLETSFRDDIPETRKQPIERYSFFDGSSSPIITSGTQHVPKSGNESSGVRAVRVLIVSLALAFRRDILGYRYCRYDPAVQ
jgi:hypothetical protein